MSGSDDTKAVPHHETYTAAPPGTLRPGDHVGDYSIHSLLASGGCGSVYMATHRVLGRHVAIKVLLPEVAASRVMFVRFLREARIANQLRHPNIVDIYDFGEAPDGRPYFVMEMLRGNNLSALIKAKGRLTPQRALEIFEPVCEALAAAHAIGVVHRDVKGSNIQVPEDASGVVKLLDFGIAKLLQNEPGEGGLTELGQRVGTPHTCAPEQLQGLPVDARSDVYALGVTLYYALVGSYPFRAGSLDEIERFHLFTPFPRPSVAAPVSAAIDEVVLRATQKRPEDRFDGVRAMLAALKAAVSVAPAVSPKTTESPALGIHLEVQLPPTASGALLDAAADLLDRAEELLSNSGFESRPLTGTCVVGVQRLPDDPLQAGVFKEKAEALARELHHLRVDLNDPSGSGALNVCLTQSRAEFRDAGGHPQLVGGEVFNVERWVVHQPAGLHLLTAER